MMESLRSVLF